MNKAYLRKIPKVDQLLSLEQVTPLIDLYGKTQVVLSIRGQLECLREAIMSGEEPHLSLDHVARQLRIDLEKADQAGLTSVVNGTGIVLHTNFGRSVLPNEATMAVQRVAEGYSNLEYNLHEGRRGSRYESIEPLLTQLTQAEAALVVNNNAAAVLLTLSALCSGKKAIVSRGELVEIGGGFRIPDVMNQSGALLCEVGSTNKTRLYDYEKAIGEDVKLLLKVHTSNYKILGFTESVDLKNLSELAKEKNLLLIEDLGSGSLIDLSTFGLEAEPTVKEAITSGADLVLFSGDKLLGGPQAGIIVGRKDLIDTLKKHPLNRALRVDKMTLAALESVLKMYLNPEKLIERLPTLRMLSQSQEELSERVEAFLTSLLKEESLREHFKFSLELGFSEVGGGAMPTSKLPTALLAIKPIKASVSKLQVDLRACKTPIVGKIEHDKFLLDFRTLFERDLDVIKDALLGWIL